VVARKALRDAAERLTPEFVVLAKRATVRGAFPGGRIVHDEAADVAQGVVFRMPQSGAHETVARRDVQIERWRGDLAAAFVEDTRTGPGFVGRLVAGKAGISLDAKQRTPDLARIGAVMAAQLRDWRLQVRDQLKVRPAHAGFIIVLMRLEPRAVVVALQRAQELERGRGKVGMRHIRL